YYVAMIPAFDTDADYIEYYISANILGKETKTNILTVNLVDMSIDPLEGIDDGTGEGEVSITASSPTRYFNDIAANDGYFAGVDLDNKAFDLAIPEKGRSTWPAVNSKWNQPRSEGTNPHKGLDLDIRTGKTIVPMLNGVVFYVQKNAGDNNYVAVQYDLHGSNHSGSADMIVYYFHINPKDGLTQGASVTAGQTELGTVNSLNHLHISMRDFSDLDLPQYYFFKDAPGMDAGYRVDLVHGPQYSGRTVTFRGYVYDQGGSAPLQSVYINYVDDNNRSRRAQMTRSGDYYSYTFPSDFSGCPVAYYLELYRSGLPYDMKAFSPAYYNIYYDGSQYVSTRPPWSACYDYLVP
ncbi:MAG: M23 family metallopeptidase, partial [Firmicutes bacterium]|nr:M23 family metallopeptidase [Bacillota bacterium]